MNELVKQTLVEKYRNDIQKLRAEAIERNLQSQYPRWVSNLMASIQKSFPEVHSELVDTIGGVK